MTRRAPSIEQRIAQASRTIEAERQAALGALRRGSDATAAAEERTARLAVDNLYEKALRRLREDDDSAARRLVERAAAVRIGEGPAGEAAATGAHLFAWEALRDAALAGGDWLDRAESVLASLDGDVRTTWADALDAVADDLELEPAEDARIDRLLEGRTTTGEPLDGVAPDRRVDVVLGLLRGILALG